MNTDQERVLDSKFGILLVKKNINLSHLFIIEVQFFIYLDAQVALCVYDITNKKSF